MNRNVNCESGAALLSSIAKSIVLSALFVLFGISAIAQNAVVGSGFSSGWGGGGCPTGNGNFNYLSGSAGSSWILTTTANGTGNQYWRYGVDWGGTTAQLAITPGSDVLVAPNVTYNLNTTCTTSGSQYYNVPNASYNYIFKTKDASNAPTGQVVFFEVQGAVQSVSSVSQSPAAGSVNPSAPVTVTANLSGALSSGQAVYLRYTNDAYATSTVVQMTGSGTTYTALIPTSMHGQNKTVSYYVFTSGTTNVAGNGSNADLYTINLNNNGGTNYSYTITNSPIVVTATGGTVGPTGYATLAAAVTAINAGTHTGVINISVCGATTEGTASIVLNASGSGSASYTSITLKPAGGAQTLTAATTAGSPFIDLNGADNVTIDGLNTGGNSLTIVNTTSSGTASTATIRFIADATNNVIQNCTIKGSGTGTASSTTLTTAVILFATGTTSGNDGNQILNNNITSNGTSYATQLIASYGTSTAVSNDNITVSGNNLFDMFATTGMAAINVGANSSAWTISSNRIYQATAQTTLTSSSYLKGIIIQTASGSGYTVSNNIIGYNSSAGTGMLTNSGGRFTGIEMSVAASPVSDIQGNTITNIAWTTASGAAALGTSPFNGIVVSAGGVNVGTTTGNTIGLASGVGSSTQGIFVTTTTTGTGIYPIYLTSATACTISNNVISGIATGGAVGMGYVLTGIAVAGAGSATVTSNTIGSATTGAITLGISGTTASCTFTGISMAATGTAVSVNSNTIRNVVNNGNNSGSSFTGINITSAGTTTTTYTVNSNTIATLSAVGNTTTSCYGINNGTNTQNSFTASSNSITGLSCASAMYGIAAGSPTTATLSSNTLTGFTTTTSSLAIYGINVQNIPTLTMSNNSIGTYALNNTTSTGSIYGFYSFVGATNVTFSNNTVSNFTTTSTSSSVNLIGFRQAENVAGTKTIQNNTISTFTGTGATIIYGFHIQSVAAYDVSGNTISGLTLGGTVIGIYSQAGNTANIYKNKIYNLSSTNAAGVVYGIQTSATATVYNIYNNIIGDLSSSAFTSATSPYVSVANLFVPSATGSVNAYNNTFYIGAVTSSGTNFSAANIYANTSTTLLLQNNLCVNLATAKGSGKAVSYLRSSTTLTSYSTSSNKNSFYGTNGLFWDGTNNYTTLTAYKTAMSTRDQSSYNENPTFASTTGSASNYLHISAGTNTPLESGGVNVALFTTDFDGDNRPGPTGSTNGGASFYDVGADEFDGITPMPVITFTSSTPALTTQCTKSSRAIVVTVTNSGAATTSSVTLNYSHNGVAQTAVTMTNTSGNTWTGTMLAPTTGNATVTWTITATNSTGYSTTYTGTSFADEPNSAITATAAASPTTLCAGSTTTLTATPSANLFTELFNGTPTAQFTVVNTSGTYTATQNSTLFAEGTSSVLFTTTNVSANGQLTQTNAISLVGNASAKLTFNHICATEAGWDYGWVEYSTDGGTTWTSFPTSSYVGTGVLKNSVVSFDKSSYTDWGTAITGIASVPTNTLWKAETVNIPAALLTSTNFKIRFRYTTDSTNDYYGWLIDNVKITGVPTISAYAWSDGSTTVATTNPATVTVPATTNYTCALTVNGCPVTSSAATVTATPLPTAPTTTASNQCGSAIPTCSATGGSAGQYRWYTASTGGTAIAGETNGTLSTYIVSSTTTLYVSINNGTCESTRTPVTITVASADVITAAASPTSIACLGNATSLSVSQTGSTNTYALTWSLTSYTGSGLSGATAGSLVTPLSVTPTATGTYVYTVTGVESASGCQSVSTVSVTVSNPNAAITAAATATPSSVCLGSATSLAMNLTSAGSGVVSSGLTAASISSYSNPIYSNWANNRSQFLILGSELTASGFSAGNITALSFNLTSTSTTVRNSYTIKMGHTATAAMTTAAFLAPTFTTVFSNNFTPAVGTNTFTFTTPFTWDGSSNVVIEMCWDNTASTATESSTASGQTTSFNSAISYNRTSTTGTSICGAANTPSTAYTTRPIFTLTGNRAPVPTAYSWSDGTSVVGTTNPLSYTVNASGTLTGTATVNGCPLSASTSVTGIALPTAPTTTASSHCGTAVPTCSASGGSAGQYRWYTAASGGTAIAGETNATLSTYTVSTTTTLYVAINNGTCESTRTPVTITVASADVLSASVTPTGNICLGNAISLAVSQTGSTNTYDLTWSLTSYTGSGLSASTSGSLVTPLSVTPTAAGTYSYTVTGVETASGCQSSSSVSVTVINPNALATATASATPNTLCLGAATSLAMNISAPGSGAVSSGLTAASISSYSNPIYSNWANNRSQFLILGSELTASGFTAGNITALSFNLTSTSTTVRNSYTIKMGHTATAAMTTAAFLAPTFTTVFSNNFTPAVGTNTFTFTTPFTWDGSSNVVIEMCWDNTTSTATESSTASGQTTSFNSAISYNRTSTTGTSVCGAANTPNTAYTTRPIFTLSGNRLTTGTAYSWSDGTSVVGTTNPLSYTPSATGTFTGTATLNGCPISASTSVTVNPLPTAPSVSNSSQCGTGIPTCSATGGSAGQYRWYTAASGGTAIAGETNGTLSTYSVSASTTLYVAINNGTCESTRTAVSISVSPPPAFTVSTDLATVCNNSVATLSVSSTVSDYTSYTWTPTTNLFSDASATTAYTTGSASTIYFKTATAGSYTLTANASNTGTGCSNVATVTVFVQPASATLSSTGNSFCNSGSATLSATPSTGYATSSIQWQSSSDNVTFADISGATSSSLATGTLTSTTYYQMLVKNSANATCLSPSIAVTVNNPAITSTTPATRCGTGTATLQATANAGSTVAWYAASTGGSPVATGTSFTTPSISATTTYYAEARVLGSTINGARLAPASTTNTTPSTYGLVFNANTDMILNSVDVYNNGSAGTLTVQLQNSAGTVLITSSVLNIPTGTGTTATTISLGWTIPAGTGYRLLATTGTASLVRESSLGGFPYAVGTVASITNGFITTPTSTTYYYFYNWNVNSVCSSTRTAVAATVNAAPALTLASSTATICNGSSSSAVALSSTASDFDTYTWTPSASVSGNSTSGWVFNPTTTTSYTLNASQSTGGLCVNSTSFNVTVNPIPSAVTVTPSSAAICTGSSTSLTASGGTMAVAGVFGTGTTVNGPTTYPAVYSVYYGGQKSQILVLASELSAAGFTSGSVISSIGFPVSSLGANWGISITSLQNFQIAMGHTANTALTAFITGLTNVRSAYNYTPVVGSASSNTHTLTTNFTWNGTSNIVIEVAFSNNIAGTTGESIIQPYSTTAANTFINYRSDNATIATILSATTLHNGPNTSRPNFTLNGSVIPTYSWSPSTALNTTSGATVSANPTSTITYTATATAPNTCTNSTTATVTVNPLPTPTFTASAGATTCLNTATTYTTQSGMTNYVWTFTGTSGTDYTIVSGGTSTSNTVSIKWLTQGSKTVTVGYTNGNGCISATPASNSTTVEGIDWANLQFPSTTTVCQGTNATAYGQVYESGVTPGAGSQGAGITVQLGVNSSNTDPSTWSAGAWTNANFNAFGGGANNDEYMLDFGSSLAPGTYYYTFRYSLNGCTYQYGGYSAAGGGFWDGTNYVNGVLTVNPTYTPSVSITTSAASVCIGTSVTFTATPTNGGSTPAYQWYLNANPVGTNTSTYTNASLADGDVVYVVMTANNTCQTTALATSNSLTTTVTPLNTYYADADQDGYGDASTSATACTAPNGYVANSTDCDDTNSDVNPGATEICNQIDDDCNSLADDGLTFTNYYVDADGDGYGSTSSSSYCANPGAGYSLVDTDCNDAASTIYPGATEVCNSLDDDCNSLIDDAITYTNYYLDQDGDGFGAGTAQSYCADPGTSFSLLNTDCNDGDASINPSASEICNSVDDNCNSTIDEGVQSTFYADADNDGFGNAASTTDACTAPTGYVANSLDCNDASASVNPNTVWYFDADGDGYYGTTTTSCTSPGANYSMTSAGVDCNDANSSISPSATETCNSVDDNCDGLIDNGIGNTYYADVDNDGYGNNASSVLACTQPAGYVSNHTDCNDSNALVNPSVAELCNLIDDNCNGTIDEGCNTTTAGEEPTNAIAALGTFYPTCMNFYGTLAGAIPSLYAQSYCLTGEDVWYTFNAMSTAATINIGTSVNDVVVELQDANGNMIDVENSVTGIGSEIMNVSGLIVGANYRVGIRNFNSGVAAGGTFSACIRYFKRGNCDSGGVQWPSTANRCAIFKATYAGASAGVQYRYTFTGTSGEANGNVYTRTQNSDYLVLTNLTPTVPSGCNYNVLVTNIYTMQDGAGNIEVIEVAAVSPCSFTVAADPSTALRTTDQCSSGPRFRGSIVASLPWVCGVTNWRWRFTEVNPINYAVVGIPIEVNRNAASNFLNLGTVTQLQYGKTYAVQTAPILSYTGTNYVWGPVSYMCIIGTAGMVLDNQSNMQENSDPKSLVSNEANLAVYPNPANDQEANLYVSGLNEGRIQIRCFDAMGKMVFQTSTVTISGSQSIIALPTDLAAGVYLVRVDAADYHNSIRYVLER